MRSMSTLVGTPKNAVDNDEASKMFNSQAEQVNRLLLDFLGVGWGSHHRSPVLSNELSSVPGGKICPRH